MKTITKFQANDGSEHTTEDAARRRDMLIEKCEQAMAPLGEMPEGVKDGKGWVQHNLSTVVACRDAILQLCCDEGMNTHYPVFNSRGPTIHPLSVIGRIISDYDGPLSKAWNRFGRIDPEGREHQQCYFAYTNGPEPDHVCIEDRR